MAPTPTSKSTSPPKKRRAVAPVAAGTSKKSRNEQTVEEEQEEPVVPLATTSTKNDSIRERFLCVFESTEYKNGISNSILKEIFGSDYVQLVPVINELTGESRLTMSKISNSGELYYQLVSTEVAQQFQGLDVSAKLVFQVIERAGNMGIWTKDIKIQTNIPQNVLGKIYKQLESRQLIKSVKSVNSKTKKLYMLYNLTPSKELTGGVWYSDLEFDHEFISELRKVLLQGVRKMNGGKGTTVQELLDTLKQSQVSKEELSTNEVSQLLQTLVYDNIVEETGEAPETGEIVYVASRRITPMCDFKWWDVLDSDFQYRAIRFEDGVELSAHEPHYQTAS